MNQALFQVPPKVPFPGLGHVYLNDWTSAAGLFGTSLAFYGLAEYRKSQFRYNSGFGPFLDPALANDPWYRLALSYQTNLWFYNIYAAYRDARTNNRDLGYEHLMPKETLDELAFAPINPNILKKPEVFLAIPIGVAAGVGILLLTDFLFPSTGQQPNVERDPVEKSFSPSSFLFAEAYGAATFLSVGIGEESIFRGAIQPMLSEPFGQVGGLIGSSLLFGAAHIPNAWQYFPNDARERNKWFASALPYITLGGFYLGYLQMKNHSLKEAVAVHSWYDFALFSIATITRSLSISGAAQIPANFSFSFPF